MLFRSSVRLILVVSVIGAAARPVCAQSRQPFSIQGSGLYTVQDFGGSAGNVGGAGIEAQALGGRPGVRSARYAGEHASDEENLALLMRQAPTGSGLRYVCALAYVDPDAGNEQVFFGTCEGRRAFEARGSGGFGYDPAFLPDDDNFGHRTMAELTDVEKDRISHRGAAARKLLAWWEVRR